MEINRADAPNSVIKSINFDKIISNKENLKKVAKFLFKKILEPSQTERITFYNKYNYI
jgi:hypothetical protein